MTPQELKRLENKEVTFVQDIIYCIIKDAEKGQIPGIEVDGEILDTYHDNPQKRHDMISKVIAAGLVIEEDCIGIPAGATVTIKEVCNEMCMLYCNGIGFDWMGTYFTFDIPQDEEDIPIYIKK